MLMDIEAGSFQFDAVSSVVVLDVIKPLRVAAENARDPLAACGLPRSVGRDQDVACRNSLASLLELLDQVLHH